ncbi:MAG: hypothetical protein ABIJ00_12880 [Candidatus Eisenbacteria bacterium]
MRILLVALAVSAVASASALAGEGFEGRPITENAFAPTGYTLNGAEFAIGLGPIAFGITDNVQASTNLLLWAFQYYNANLKVAFAESDDHAFAVGVGLGRLSLDFVDGDDEAEFTSVSPYAAGSFRIGGGTMAHIGGQYSHFSASGDSDIEDADASAVATGTSFFGGFEHSVSNRTKFVADAGYDATFEGARVSGAVLFGWTTFRLKLGLSYFTAGDGFTFPLVGLWWRFDA